MSCRRCPACEKDRTRIVTFPYTCSCGFRAAKACDLTLILDCEPPRRSCGVGCHLKKIFAWLVRADGKCGCEELAAEMDSLGPAGCRREFRRLVVALKAKANERSLALAAVAPLGVPWALRRAIRQTEELSRESPAVN